MQRVSLAYNLSACDLPPCQPAKTSLTLRVSWTLQVSNPNQASSSNIYLKSTEALPPSCDFFSSWPILQHTQPLRRGALCQPRRTQVCNTYRHAEPSIWLSQSQSRPPTQLQDAVLVYKQPLRSAQNLRSILNCKLDPRYVDLRSSSEAIPGLKAVSWRIALFETMSNCELDFFTYFLPLHIMNYSRGRSRALVILKHRKFSVIRASCDFQGLFRLSEPLLIIRAFIIRQRLEKFAN